MKYKMLC